VGQCKLILASASPRRKDLLQQLGVEFICRPAHIDETPGEGESPSRYVERLAREKAGAVFRSLGNADAVVLAADTTVVVDDQVLGKPRDIDDGMAMLARLSGRNHRVLTGICLCHRQGVECEVVATEVHFVVLTEQHRRAYLATDEPWDKAGAYGIQGLGGAFISDIVGSYSNVVGLPLYETWQLLRRCGIPTTLEPSCE
jgi:septum formation protein